MSGASDDPNGWFHNLHDHGDDVVPFREKGISNSLQLSGRKDSPFSGLGIPKGTSTLIDFLKLRTEFYDDDRMFCSDFMSMNVTDRAVCRKEYELALEEYRKFLTGCFRRAGKRANVSHEQLWIKTATALTDALLALCEHLAPEYPLPEGAVELFATLPIEFRNRRNPVSMSSMLHYLARHDLVDEMRLLLNSVDVNVDARDVTMATPLILVAQLGGDLRLVELLLRAGANTHLFDDQNMTAAHYAAKQGRNDLLTLLSTFAAQPGCKKRLGNDGDPEGDPNGEPEAVLTSDGFRRRAAEILFALVLSGSTVSLQQLLLLPEYLLAINDLVMIRNKKTEQIIEGTTLYIACSFGRTEIVRKLLAAGADPNILAKNGCSCLFVASMNGYSDIVNALIDHKADAKMKNKNDVTPLTIAAYGGFLEIVLKLIAHGADVNQGDKMGAKPIHGAVLSGKVAVAEALLLNGADVNGVTVSGISPMYVAAKSGDLDMVRLFLSYTPPPAFASKVRPCNIDIMNKEGLTPLIVAAFNNRLDVVNLLIEREADVNLTKGKKVTAIYAASQNGHVEVVKRLLQEHVDVNLLIGNGNTAMHGAAIEARLDVIKLLHEAGAFLDVFNDDRATPLYMACEKGHIEVVNFLIDVGKCDPNVVNKHQVSPMNIASQNGHFEVVKKLIASGGLVNSQTEDGPTPLFIAAQNGFADICRILVEAGANVDLLTKERESAIFDAGYFGYLPIVELLLKTGAQFNIVDCDGRTPLWWACKAGRVEVVKLLLSHNADINKADRKDITPLQIATTQRHVEVCELLMSIKTPLTLCVTCLTNARSIVSLPCRHLSFCADCSFKMERSQKKECPVCRTAITEFMAVYTQT